MASVFTKIINRELPAHIVHEDSEVIAFLDIRPVAPGHMLVVPKKEVDQFQDLDSETYQKLMSCAQQMARLIKEKLNPVRVGMVIYGFDVPHVHVHLIPMSSPGGIQMLHADGVSDEELAAMKERLAD